jgi:hypothetical protein
MLFQQFKRNTNVFVLPFVFIGREEKLD